MSDYSQLCQAMIGEPGSSVIPLDFGVTALASAAWAAPLCTAVNNDVTVI